MPWKQETVMSLRKEFVALAHSGALPFSQLCQRFEVSRKTGYKWLSRASVNPAEDFSDRSGGHTTHHAAPRSKSKSRFWRFAANIPPGADARSHACSKRGECHPSRRPAP